MIYEEKQMNLFSLVDDERYCFAHCISADFALGAGIAVEFNKRFDCKNKLRKYFGDYKFPKPPYMALTTGRVFNLVTKEKYWQKPTLESIGIALSHMRDLMIINGDKKVAMPKIGCGLDGKNWIDVSKIIKDVFKDTDIEILVCYL